MLFPGHRDSFEISLLLHSHLSHRASSIPGFIPHRIYTQLTHRNATQNFVFSRAAEALLVVHLPGIAAMLGHELQVLDAHGLVLQLCHGIVHTLLPRRDVVLLPGGWGGQLVPAKGTAHPGGTGHGSPWGRQCPNRPHSPLHAEQLQGLPGRQALKLVPHDLGLWGRQR